MKVKNRSLFKPRARGTYRIESKAEETTVYIYDEISWFGVSAEQFVKDLNAIDSKTIHLRVNSPGGSVFEGVAIYNAIKQHNSKVIAHIDGLAASIASIIVLAADEVKASENAFYMVHQPWSIVIGDAEDMRAEADLLDKVGGVIAKTYTDKTGKSEDEILDLMAAETWMTAQEALDAGFIDAIDKDSDEKARATMNLFDLSAFANVPDSLLNDRKPPTAREAEKALRDVGFTQNQAKSILAEGYKGEQRDVAHQADQRDVAAPEPKKKDRIADLLTRAEIMAPSQN